MKSSGFFFLLLLLVSRLSAAETRYKLTPQTLIGWNANGVELSALVAQNDLNLPAGAQLSRSFATGEVVLQVVVQPYFGTDAAEAPSLEVGPALLAFSRESGSGKLLLVVGDAAPVILPIDIALDDDGRSARPLELTLGFDGGSGLVRTVIAGQSLSAIPTPGRLSQIEVALVSGTAAKWPLGKVELTVVTSDAPSDSSPHSLSAAVRSLSNNLASTLSRSAASGVAIGSAVGSPGANKLPGSVTSKADKGPPLFGVFTPPSVRLHPIEQIAAPITVTAVAR